MIVCVNLESFRVIWEKQLKSGQDLSVYNDLLCSQEGVFVYTREGFLFGLNRRNGDLLFNPIENVSAPPCYHDGNLYFGFKDGTFVNVRANSGNILGSLDLGEKVTTRPVINNNNIILGTAGGNIMLINAGSF